METTAERARLIAEVLAFVQVAHRTIHRLLKAG